MEQLRLDVELSACPVVFGTWALGEYGWGDTDRVTMSRAIDRAIELGVTMIDTADVYGFGRSESSLQAVLVRHPHVRIATKFGVRWDAASGRTHYDSSPAYTASALDDSLRRLGREPIDLYQIHWPDPKTELGATLEVLQRAHGAGKIRAIGVSNFSHSQIRAAQRHATIASAQSPFSLVDQRIRRDLLDPSDLPSVAILGYAPLAQGLLTGKHPAGVVFDVTDVRSRSGYFDPSKRASLQICVDALRLVGQKYGKTQGQVAIRWALQTPGISAVVVGAKTIEQASENIATNWEMARDDYNYLDGIALAALASRD